MFFSRTKSDSAKKQTDLGPPVLSDSDGAPHEGESQVAADGADEQLGPAEFADEERGEEEELIASREVLAGPPGSMAAAFETAHKAQVEDEGLEYQGASPPVTAVP